MSDNVSNFLHYNITNGSIIEPIERLYIKSLTVLDIDDPNNEGIAIEADISIANAQNLRVQTIEGVENDDPDSVGEKEIDLITNLVFDPGFGIFFPGSDDKLTTYITETVSFTNWNEYPFGEPRNTSFKGRFTKIGDIVNLKMWFDTPSATILTNPGNTGWMTDFATNPIPAAFVPVNPVYVPAGVYVDRADGSLHTLTVMIEGSNPSYILLIGGTSIQWPAGTYAPPLMDNSRWSVTYSISE